MWKKVKENLIKNGEKYLKDWEIPMSRYEGSVVAIKGAVTCAIFYQHKNTGVFIVLRNVYYNRETGEILQCEVSFR